MTLAEQIPGAWIGMKICAAGFGRTSSRLAGAFLGNLDETRIHQTGEALFQVRRRLEVIESFST